MLPVKGSDRAVALPGMERDQKVEVGGECEVRREDRDAMTEATKDPRPSE
jgi:hypothetical protein